LDGSGSLVGVETGREGATAAWEERSGENAKQENRIVTRMPFLIMVVFGFKIVTPVKVSSFAFLKKRPRV
jgi:hypothetical protein